MPPTLNPFGAKGVAGSRNATLRNTNLGYEYPENLNLRPGTKLHDELVDLVLRYANNSHQHMSSRHDSWTEIDKVLKSYSYTAPVGGPRDKKGQDSDGNLFDSSRRIIMPVSYVVLETLMTYMSSAFFRSPMFQYEGTGPEDILGSLLLTQVVDTHVHKNGVPLSLHTSLRDMFAYGVGYASPRWDMQMGRKIVKQPTGLLDIFNSRFLQQGSKKVDSPYEVLFEGNTLDNIDPYLALPDPNVSPHEIQKSEMFGWVDETSYSELRRLEASETSGLFNVRYLKILADRGGDLLSHLNNKGERRKQRETARTDSGTPADAIHMYINLIPKEMGLGQSEDPETWIFVVGADQILLRAEPLDLVHGQIPVAAGAPDYDGYSVAPTSRLLVIEEMQQLIDFLYTSHVENIKRVINDNLVVDPSMINIHDVNDNRPGKVIRIMKKGWGANNIRNNSIFQLDVKDATQQNVQDAVFLMEQAKVATSTMDQLLGNLSPRTTRISASESQSVRQSGFARLERPAQLISYQFMLPIARMFASNVQQFMDEETFVKATGDLRDRLERDFGITPERGRVKVNPLDLIVNYDVTAHDGAIPGKADTQTLTEMFQVLTQSPELAQGFDMQRLFKHIARQSGVTNVDDFVRQGGQPQGPPQVLPDEEVAREVERGNFEPV